MSRTRSVSSRFRTAAFALLALLLVAVGGTVFAAPAAAAAGAPVVIDDFSGGILGTRTVTALNYSSRFSESAGVGHIIGNASDADLGGVTLNYALPSVTDLTSHGNNTQFFLQFNSIERSPNDDNGNAASVSIQLTDSAGHQGTYNTGIQSVAPFNIVLNFNCSAGGTCFSGAVDFTKITNVLVYVMTPGNYDDHQLDAYVDMIRTTPTGGAVPSPPTPTVLTPSTSVASLNDTTVNFNVHYTVEGTVTAESGLTAANIVVSGTAGGIGTPVVTGGPGSYNVAVGPLTSSGTVTIGVKANAVTDGWGQGSDPSGGEPVVTFTKEVVPVITVATTATATVGAAFDLKATSTGVPTPAFSVSSGTLPAGLTLSASGDLSGTPALGSGGVYSLVIKSLNAVGNSTGPLTLTVNEAPGFTSAATATFSESTAGNFSVTTRGYPAPTLSETVGSALPSGVTFTANANGTATIAGTPALGTNGSYTVALLAGNGIGVAVSQSLVVTTTSAPVITTSAQDQIVAPGATVTFTAAATSTPSPTVKWQRTNNAGTYVDIPGATATSYSFVAATTDSGHKYQAVFSNGVGQQAMTAATLTVRLAPTITSSNAGSFVVGTTGSISVLATGFPSPALTLTGAPAWLTLQDNGNGTGSLTGSAPAAEEGATLLLTITASNGVTTDATQQFALTVKQGPTVIASPQNTVVTPDSTVTLSAVADGFPVPTVQWQRSTNGGASFQNVPGATSVNYSFVASLGNNGDEYRAVFTNQVSSATTGTATVRVGIAPVFMSAPFATFDAGVTGTVTIQTSAAPAAAITAGTRPAWLTFHDNGDGTATLSGTPSGSDAGQHTVILTATNTFDPDAQQSFVLSVDVAPQITSATTTTFSVGVAGSFQVATTAGFPVVTNLTETGTLPGGVTLVDNHDGTAELVGTPTAGTGGSYPFTIAATSVGGDALGSSQSFVLVVRQSPVVTSPGHTIFSVGTSSTFTVTTDAGYPAPTTISRTGALPTGLTFVDNGNGTATIAGTPAAGSGGSYLLNLTAAADGGVGLSSSSDLTITVLESPTFVSSPAETLDVGVASSFTVITTPGFPTTTSVTMTGTLPAGITFVDNGDGTASLSGTPLVASGGDYPLSFTATSVGGLASTQAFDLVVRESPAFTSASSAAFQSGSFSSFTVVTSHDYPTATAISVGSLPAGIGLVDNGDGTATLSGTPTAPGDYTLQFSATNRVPVLVTQSFDLTVAISPTLPSNLDSSFVAGVTSTVTLISTPGVPAIRTLSVVGTLPTGITFTDNGDGTATLGGSAAPDSVGAYGVEFAASNGVSPATSYTATITVTAADPVTLPPSVPQANGTVSGVPGQSTQGDVLTVSGLGFAPGAPLTVGIYSTPTYLGSLVADATGAFTGQVTLPALLGVHTVVVSGIDPDGNPLFLTAQTTITARRSGLPTTGVAVGGALYLVFLLFASGALVLGFAYRRRVSARAPR